VIAASGAAAADRLRHRAAARSGGVHVVALDLDAPAALLRAVLRDVELVAVLFALALRR